MKIGLISDTHGYIDDRILELFKECDEIWHAGDIGTTDVIDRLSKNHTFRGVYGNIDGHVIRSIVPEDAIFTIESMKVWIRHIGGYPPKYTSTIRELLDEIQPDIFICGHSHILKVLQDKDRKVLHLNPGAAGVQGFHKMRTMMRFDITKSGLRNMEAIELGSRGKIKP